MAAGFAYYRAAIESVRQNSAAAPPSMPVLAIGGEGSLGSAMHRALEAAKTPDLQEAVFAGVGHYLPEEAPREFVDDIVRFASFGAEQLVYRIHGSAVARMVGFRR
jgi:pimeloyl-ACP methyl ester carboxylesterase